ncbi:MAG: gamma-glutamylcyclotransferase [Deltaproteobacteria bacterium]|nr:gamma-glutamylcyclotransferase [Deltaproteobacteria bacterium]
MNTHKTFENKTLCFVYGSNLNLNDFDKWLTKRDYRDYRKEEVLGGFNFVKNVILPDHELAFTRWSETRKGGVLDVREKKGAIVRGALFAASDKALAALDEKEGVSSGCYRRKKVKVIDGDGNFIEALTYCVREDRRESFVEPSEEYLKIVQAGYERFGIPLGQLSAAANNVANRGMLDSLFVYGTLMRGELRHGCVCPERLKCALLAESFGRLYLCGDEDGYPAMVLDYEDRTRLVQGEFLLYGAGDMPVARLDEIEKFDGYKDLSRNFYNRTVIEVGMCDGRTRFAWVYVYNGDVSGLRELKEKCWREFRGSRKKVLAVIADEHAQGIGPVDPEKFYGYGDIGDIPEGMSFAEALECGLISERKLAQSSGKWTVVIS